MSASVETLERTRRLPELNFGQWLRWLMLPTRLLKSVPFSDLIALGLLFWMMTMVGWSVQLARWGDLPSIVPTLLIGSTIAFVMSRIRIPWLLKLAVFLIGGVAVVFWQGSIPADGANVIERSIDAYKRFELWIDIAINGGVSGDSVPFAMLFMTVSWIVSYSVAALTFRFHSPWIPALILGLSLLTNLSHRHGLHEQTFYLFMVGAIAQFAHLVAVRRLDIWREANITAPREAMWVAARDGIILGVIVMLIAAVMPLYEPRSLILRDGWNTVFLDPLARFKSTAERLLAGIPSGDEGLMQAPNSVMPFRGGIQLTDEPIMWVRSRYAKLHPGRVYQEYTSSGWVSAPSVVAQASSRSQLAEVPSEVGIEKRDLIQMSVQPTGGTDLVVPAAAVHTVDYNADVEILEPLAWDVPLIGSPENIATMPEDLREMAFALRFRLADIAAENSPGNQFTLNNHPPQDTETVSAAIEEIRDATDLQIDEDEQLVLTFFVGMSDQLETIDPEDIDPTAKVTDISSDELIDVLRVSAGDVDYQGLIRIPITLRQLLELRMEALNRGYDDEAELLADFDGFIRGESQVESSIDWDSFSYNIFTERDGTDATMMRIVRHGPPEQNTVTFSNTLEKNQQYQVGTYVSTAENEELALSPDEYPHWVTDRYLQLPLSLPSRVRQLARFIVDEADADTPWEKISAIKQFLQNQIYSLEIKGPGPFEDGVDYFLFETVSEPCPSEFPSCDASKIKGYSQYFGSAATVMLRSVGVPARMIAGWSVGEYMPDQGQFLIRDSNRHGWTQVYLPPYGWIDIEVTPGRPAAPRNVRVPTVPFANIPPEIVSSAEFDPDFMEDLEYLDSLALEARAFLARQRAQDAQQGVSSAWPVPWISLAAAVFALLLVAAAVFAWRWNLRGKPMPVRAYIQFSRIAALVGYRRWQHHSAREFAARLDGVSGQFRSDAELIVRSYELSIYGGDLPKIRDSEVEDDENGEGDEVPSVELDDHRELSKAWRRMARAIAAYRIKRILGINPPLANETPDSP